MTYPTKIEVFESGQRRAIAVDLGLLRLASTRRPWREPTEPLPIDECVSELIHSDRIVVRQQDAECPYKVARKSVYNGVIMAMLGAGREFGNSLFSDDSYDRASAAAAAGKFKKSDTALKMLHKLYGQVNAFGPAATGDAAAAALRAQDALLQLIIDLPVISTAARSTHEALSQNKGKEWKVAFAAQMLDGWSAITGERSSVREVCLNFVTAGWRSINRPPPPDENWRRPLEIHARVLTHPRG